MRIEVQSLMVPGVLLSQKPGEPFGRKNDLHSRSAPERAESRRELNLTERVAHALHATGYGALRDIAVTAHGRDVTVSGRVSSYYLKQVAQVIALSIPGIDQVRNRIVVATTGSLELQPKGLVPAILVVDDDGDIRSNMTDLLSDRGYRVDSAECGNTALEMARNQRYDLGLLDVRMPGMDGLTLCGLLKQRLPGMKAMIVTAFLGPKLYEDALAAGAERVLLKPVDVDKLLALVAQLLPDADSEAAE